MLPSDQCTLALGWSSYYQYSWKESISFNEIQIFVLFFPTVNLAVALAMECRLRVGLLDADVYGPSIPNLMKLDGRPELDSGTYTSPISFGACWFYALVSAFGNPHTLRLSLWNAFELIAISELESLGFQPELVFFLLTDKVIVWCCRLGMNEFFWNFFPREMLWYNYLRGVIQFVSVCNPYVACLFMVVWKRVALLFAVCCKLLHVMNVMVLCFEKMSLSYALLFCRVKDDTTGKLWCALHVYGISYGEGRSSCLERSHGNYVCFLLPFLFPQQHFVKVLR